MASTPSALSIAPDGKTIACIAAARLTLHAGDGRTPARQYVQPQNGASNRYSCVAWAPDAKLVACGSTDGAVPRHAAMELAVAAAAFVAYLAI